MIGHAHPLVALLACGLAAGLVAGLVGAGGGIVAVPMLVQMLPWLGVTEVDLIQTATATSLVAMMPTALRGALLQYRQGTLDIRWLRRLAPSIAGGTLLGCAATIALGRRMPAAVPAATMMLIGILMFQKPQAQAGSHQAVWFGFVDRLPVWSVGTLIGLLTATTGFGGAFLSVPYLASQRVDVRNAIGTGSGVALLVTMMATLSFATFGLAEASHKCICWQAAFCIGFGALCSVRMGVRFGRSLPRPALQRVFACVLLIAAVASMVLRR